MSPAKGKARPASSTTVALGPTFVLSTYLWNRHVGGWWKSLLWGLLPGTFLLVSAHTAHPLLGRLHVSFVAAARDLLPGPLTNSGLG